MEKTLKRKREQDHFSVGSAKMARKSSSPDLKENHEYDDSREESCGNILATMSQEFLDLYDDLDDWGQEYCAPEQERIKVAASEYSHNNLDGVVDDEYLTDMGSYDDLEDWRDAKFVSNSDTESEDSDSINLDGVADEEYLTDMDCYDDLEECRHYYWEEDMIYSKSVSSSASELSGDDGETCESTGKTEEKAICDNDFCEEKARISYGSDYIDVAIAEMKERIKKKKAIIQAWQLDDLQKRHQITPTIQMIGQ